MPPLDDNRREAIERSAICVDKETLSAEDCVACLVSSSSSSSVLDASSLLFLIVNHRAQRNCDSVEATVFLLSKYKIVASSLHQKKQRMCISS